MTATAARPAGLAAERPLPLRSEGIHVAEFDAVRVEVIDAVAFTAMRPAWRALAEAAQVPNAFMDPAVVAAVAQSSPRPLRVLVAWHGGGPTGSPPRLVGAWPFALGRSHAAWPFRALVSPIHDLAYLGTPVIDAAFARPALAAMLDKVRDSPDLPRLIQASDLSDGAFMADLLSVLAEAGMSATRIERRTRARLQGGVDPKTYWANSMSALRLQGMARKRRQLAKCGRLEFSVTGDPAAVAAGLEDFLALEASGWKGARGSALASHPDTAALTRAMVSGLAADGLARIHALRLDGRALAMWVVLHSGHAAFTWRTGYDEAYARFSPGVLVLEDTTAALLSDPEVAVTDSCNHRDQGFQAERWAGRHDVVDLLIDVRSGSPRLARCLGAKEWAYRGARNLARAGLRRTRQVVGTLKARIAR